MTRGQARAFFGSRPRRRSCGSSPRSSSSGTASSTRFFGGCFGIFGHGNVAGIGQALHQSPELLTYYQGRNEQSMVHAAVGYARMRNRLGALACTTSIGPGATNMVTGAALATVNRLPVLLLPGDVFATHPADPVLQQLEVPSRGDVSVNDAFAPVSRYFDRDLAARAADSGGAGRDARAHLAGRDRRGDARAAAGRADRGVRLARGVPRARASGTCRAPRPTPARWRVPSRRSGPRSGR